MADSIEFMPPYSDASEQSVIGGLLLENDAYDKILGVVTELDFLCP